MIVDAVRQAVREIEEEQNNDLADINAAPEDTEKLPEEN